MEEFLKFFLDFFIELFRHNTKVLVILSILIIVTFLIIFWI